MSIFKTRVWRTNPQNVAYIDMPNKQVFARGNESIIKEYILTPLPCDECDMERAYLTLVLLDPSKHNSERMSYHTSTYTIFKCDDEDNEYMCEFEDPILPTGEREYFA